MGWYEDQLVSRVTQMLAAEMSAGKDKGKGKGKTGRITDGKGKGKGKTGDKIPCISHWCTAKTFRNEPACHHCYAPLDTDGSAARAAAAEVKAAGVAASDYIQPARVKKKNGQKMRAAKKTADAAAASAAAAVADAAKTAKLPKPSYLNAAAVAKAHPFEPDDADQMEVDANGRVNPPVGGVLNSADDLKRMGLPLVPVAPANLVALLSAYKVRDPPPTPEEVVAQATASKVSGNVVCEKVADLEKQIALLSKVANSGPTLKFLKDRVAEEKLLKETSAPVAVTPVLLEKMKSQRQDARLVRSSMVASAEKSRAGAIARQERLRGAYTAHVAAAQAGLDAFEDRVRLVNKGHSEGAVESLEYQDRIQEAWDKKILVTEAMLPTPSGATGSAAPFISEVRPLDQMTPEATAAATAIVLAKEQADAANAAAQTASAVIAAQHLANDYFLQATWSDETVAKLKVKDMVESEREFLHFLSVAMVQWSQHGMCQCTYANLFGDPQDSTKSMGTLRELVGSGYWSELYGSRSVVASNVVPQQMHAVITFSLQKIAAALTEVSDVKTTDAQKVKASGVLTGVLKNVLKSKVKASKA